MFAYPKQAEFNRPLPKSKIYAHAKPVRKVKELFVAQVSEIIWKYKLSQETTNLPSRHGISEIQVFQIDLKAADYDPAILRTIDKAIPFPLVFQLIHGQNMGFAASYKRPSDTDSTKWVIEASFATDWIPRSSFSPRPFPVALDLSALYQQMIRAHIPIPPLPQEGVRDHVARFLAIETKQREAQQLAIRLQKEKQFNRKVELNRELRDLGNEIEALAGS